MNASPKKRYHRRKAVAKTFIDDAVGALESAARSVPSKSKADAIRDIKRKLRAVRRDL